MRNKYLRDRRASQHRFRSTLVQTGKPLRRLRARRSADEVYATCSRPRGAEKANARRCDLTRERQHDHHLAPTSSCEWMEGQTITKPPFRSLSRNIATVRALTKPSGVVFD